MRRSTDAHVARRETRAGRWLPAAFYALNAALWLLTGVAAGGTSLLPLVLLALPALAAYVWRTR